MSNVRITRNTGHTTVLHGVGPNIKLKSPAGATVTVVNGSKVKTLNLGPATKLEFVA